MKKDEDLETVVKICQQLQSLRVSQGISQQRLAEKAGVSRTGLRHVESGDINPTLYTLLKISKALNCRLSQLLENDA